MRKSLPTILMLLTVCFTTMLSQPTIAVSLEQQVMGQIEAGADAAGMDEPSDPRALIMLIIYIALAGTGILFVVLIITGSFWYITSHGDEERVKKATHTIEAAVIGLVIVLLAYSITMFIGSRIGPAVTAGEVVPH